MEAREESDIERLHRFKNGETYTANMKLTRNPKFHRKVMAYFCFTHWCTDRAGIRYRKAYQSRHTDACWS